jgi:hypothetical protein
MRFSISKGRPDEIKGALGRSSALQPEAACDAVRRRYSETHIDAKYLGRQIY